jgi:hypothetical protein
VYNEQITNYNAQTKKTEEPLAEARRRGDQRGIFWEESLTEPQRSRRKNEEGEEYLAKAREPLPAPLGRRSIYRPIMRRFCIYILFFQYILFPLLSANIHFAYSYIVIIPSSIFISNCQPLLKPYINKFVLYSLKQSHVSILNLPKLRAGIVIISLSKVNSPALIKSCNTILPR